MVTVFTFTKLKDSSILVLTLYPGFTMKEHVADIIRQHLAYLDATRQPTPFIVDMRSVSLSCDDLLYGIERIAQNAERLRQHPNYLGGIYVTNSATERIMLNLMKREIVGRLPIRVVNTMPEALAMCKSSPRAIAYGNFLSSP